MTSLPMTAFALLAAIGSSLLTSLPPPQNPPTVDLCDLFRHPPELRGKVVEVDGTAVAGFETLILRAECSERVTRDTLFDRVCLDMAGADPEGEAKQDTGETVEEPVAIAEVSEHEFIERVLSDGYATAVDAMPWKPLVYEAAEVREDEIWYAFFRAIREESILHVTLKGRFEYVDTPSMVRFRDGRVGRLTGYGHMGACSARLVVTQVVRFASVQK